MAEQSSRIIRIRDPIHDLVTFDPDDSIDGLALRLVNTREFQRLRRIRQLGFSELVFPGATHTRFSHCLGAFFIARKLLNVIGEKTGKYDEHKGKVAAIAALLHDIGHGPFSHVFEGVLKELKQNRRHEDWGAEIITGDSEIHQVLDSADAGLAKEIALLLGRKDPVDIYDSVVSSQFDADRLDYIQRDRYMSGTKTGGFDFQWLLNCLETGEIRVGQQGVAQEDYVTLDGLYLGHKGLAAAEGYLLARFHLYSQVYLHKTTRGAERMLSALLGRVAKLVRSGKGEETGLNERQALLRFFTNEKPDLRSYLDLDDATVSAGIWEMTEATDQAIRKLATRLRDRRLYKCFDAGILAKRAGGNSLQRFLEKIRSLETGFDGGLLRDDVPLTAYGFHEYEDRGALQKVLIGRADGTDIEDIAESSEIVRSIGKRRICRVYCSDKEGVERLGKVWKEVNP